jgi:hypothetical protein
VYEVGDAVRLSWRVLDHTRKLTDATVTATLVAPSGTSSALTVERSELGTYITTVVPTVVGRHVVRWRAVGAVTDSQTDVLNVASAVEPVALISLDYLKAFLNKDDQVEDDELREFIDTASLVVEEYTGQVWARRTLTEEVYVIGRVGYLRPPVVTVTAVTGLDGTELAVPTSDAINGFTGSINGLADGWVSVTYTAGPTEVPEHVQTATAIIAAHLWTTQRPAGPAAPGFGSGEVAPSVPGRGYLIPNQAAQLLGGKAANRP